MKTLYIDIEEEVTSVIDRIRKITDREIILVIPQRALVLQSIVNLKLLKKQAQIFGRKIIIVTSDQLGKHLATRAGLEVRARVGNQAILATEIEAPQRGQNLQEFPVSSPEPGPKIESVQELSAVSVSDIVRRAKSQKFFPVRQQKSKPRKISKPRKSRSAVPRRPKKASYPKIRRKSRPKFSARLSSISAKLGLGFIGVSIILIVLIVFLVLPKAKVTIIPKTEPISQVVSIVVRTDINEMDNLTKAIPGEVLTLEKQETQIFPTATKREIAAKATGEVTLYNEKGASQILVATTRLMSPQNILFRTQDRVVIPPATVSEEGTVLPGTVNVKVSADQTGPEGNIGPTDFYIVAFNEEQRRKVYAKSTDEFRGGDTREVGVLTQEDIDRAKQQVAENLINMGKEEIKAELDLDYDLPETAIKGEILETNANQEVGAETESFELTVKVNLKALVFSSREAKELALNSVLDVLEKNKYILDADKEEGITFEIENINLEEKKALLNVRISKEVAWKTDAEAIRQNIAGRSEAEAMEYLKSLDEILEVNLELWPFWVRSVPSLHKKIEVVISSGD